MEKETNLHLNISGSKGESSCHTFIRSVSKLLFKDGSGDPCMLKHYLLKDMKTIPMQNFKGNRFNVLFYNAAGVNLIRNFIMSYLGQTKQSLNLFQDSVLNGLKMPRMMSLCRVLSIIYCLITRPYWHYVIQPNMSAIELGPNNKFVQCLKRWCEDV